MSDLETTLDRPFLIRELERAGRARTEALARCEQAAKRALSATPALRAAQTELVIAADAHLKSCAEAEKILAHLEQLRRALLGAVLEGE